MKRYEDRRSVNIAEALNHGEGEGLKAATLLSFCGSWYARVRTAAPRQGWRSLVRRPTTQFKGRYTYVKFRKTSHIFIAATIAVLSISDAHARFGEPPKSLSEGLLTSKADIATIELPAVDVERLLTVHQKKAYEAKPLRFAVPNELTVSPKSHGDWIDVKGGRIWQLRFTSENATDVNFGFTKFHLPEGAMLHVMSFADDPVYYDGPYTAKDNQDYRQFWSPPVPGGDVAVELYLPDGAINDLELELTRVSTGFRDIFKRYGGAGLLGKQGACNNDVVCPEGDPWRDEIRSVAAYTISGTDTCTGTLIMDADRTFTPWFLTAFHCGVTAGAAPQMVTIWNYESANCGDLSGGSRMQTVSGAIFRARRQDVDSGLVELSSEPPESFNVYYAGWDRSGSVPAGSVGIHHPGVDEKAISFNTDALTTVNNCIGGGGSNTHWEVNNWEDGTTEPGSSGSAIFDPSNKLVVGFLSGGTASCSSITSDCYGKFSEGWDNGGIDSLNLAPWLDPGDTGVMTVDGSNPSPFSITSNPTSIGICAGDDAVYALDIPQNDPMFMETVTLTTMNLPAGTSGVFTQDMVVPPGSSTLTVSNTGGVASGDYDFEVIGTAMSDTRNRMLSLTVNATTPGSVGLTAPADAAMGVSTAATYSWDADSGATSYLIEIASDSGFTDIVDSATVTDTTYESSIALLPETTYYWRVTAENGCGSGTPSNAFSFITANEYCFAPDTSIPDNNPAGGTAMAEILELASINSMTVSLVSNHTWPGDLIVTLSHNGTDVILMDRPGVPAGTFGCGQDGVDVTFDDASGTPVEGVCNGTSPGIGGVVAPEQMLGAFVGDNLNGTWELNISDNAGQDTGNIQEWCLSVDSTPISPFIFADGFEPPMPVQ